MKLKFTPLFVLLAACGTSQYYPDDTTGEPSVVEVNTQPSSISDDGVPKPDDFTWYYINGHHVAHGEVTVWFDTEYSGGGSLDSIYLEFNGKGQVVYPYETNEFEATIEVDINQEDFVLTLGSPAFRSGSNSYSHKEKWQMTKTLKFDPDIDQARLTAQPDEIVFHTYELSALSGSFFELSFSVEHSNADEELGYVWVRINDLDQRVLFPDADGEYSGMFLVEKGAQQTDIEIGNGPYNRYGNIVLPGEDWTLEYYVDHRDDDESESDTGTEAETEADDELADAVYPTPDFFGMLEWTTLESYTWWWTLDFTSEMDWEAGLDCQGIMQLDGVTDYQYYLLHCSEDEIINYTFHANSFGAYVAFNSYYRALKDELSEYFSQMWTDENGQEYEVYEFMYSDRNYAVYLADDIPSTGWGYEIHFEWTPVGD